jgi:D-glycero-alpha-D-manno-heptose-7-phosphate kinase
VLKEQNMALQNGGGPGSVTAEALHEIKDLGRRILVAIEEEDFDAWGALLHEHWQAKQRLSHKVSLDVVDRLYNHVRDSYGVLGGKIAGAGGGGFLMLYCPRQHRRLEAFMAEQGMPRLHYDVSHDGAKVVADLVTTPALRRGVGARAGALTNGRARPPVPLVGE